MKNVLYNKDNYFINMSYNAKNSQYGDNNKQTQYPWELSPLDLNKMLFELKNTKNTEQYTKINNINNNSHLDYNSSPNVSNQIELSTKQIPNNNSVNLQSPVLQAYQEYTQTDLVKEDYVKYFNQEEDYNSYYSNQTNQNFSQLNSQNDDFELKSNNNKVDNSNLKLETKENFDLNKIGSQNSNSLADRFGAKKSTRLRPPKNTFLRVDKNIGPLEIYNQDFSQTFSHRKLKFGIWQKITTISLLILLISGVFIWNNLNSKIIDNDNAAVAGAIEDIEKSSAYRLWIVTKNNGQYSPPEADLDNDKLLNYEEFLIDSNPMKDKNCENQKTDMENILNLINPKTCQVIDFSNEEQLKNFNKIVDLNKLQETLKQQSSTQIIQQSVKPELKQEDTQAQNSSTSVITLQASNYNLENFFGVEDYNQINTLKTEALNSEQKGYQSTIEKIDKYINKYRSYEIYDKNYNNPVHSAVYLETSLKYNVELKYVLAIARQESRFGTDRYTNSGALTRPGQYQNIYSIGLNDAGQNLGYSSWEEGVYGFGKWYQKMHQKNISDCQKWRIYNPNGDYCQKTENLANQIQSYLAS